jgi:hypothetical protein
MSDIQDQNRPATLAELGDFDITDVEAVRFVLLPAGGYRWRITEAGLDTLTMNDKKTGEPSDVPVANVVMQVIGTHGLVNIPDGYTEADFMDKTHTERFFIRDMEGVGRIKAFAEDIGWSAPPGQRFTFQGMLDAFVGHEFDSRGKHRKNKNDPTQVFFQLDFDKKVTSARKI